MPLTAFLEWTLPESGREQSQAIQKRVADALAGSHCAWQRFKGLRTILTLTKNVRPGSANIANYHTVPILCPQCKPHTRTINKTHFSLISLSYQTDLHLSGDSLAPFAKRSPEFGAAQNVLSLSSDNQMPAAVRNVLI